MRIFELGFIMFTVSFAQAQATKNEVEKRIDRVDMPEKAGEYLKTTAIDLPNFKFYLEKDGELITFEAKGDFKGGDYSIEFDDQGILLDIEIDLPKRRLPAAVKKIISMYLDATFARHRIENVQQQFSAGNQENAFVENAAPDAYELIIATKNKQNRFAEYEMTFDALGSFIESRKVERRSYDFLLF